MWRGKVITKRKKGKPSFYPYKSGLEKRVGSVLKSYSYEPKDAKVPYSSPHIYNPDFVHPDIPWLLIEVKGYFRDGSKEATKYVNVSRDNPSCEIVFIFTDPHKKAYPQCRVRKDGTILTLAEWCKKNNFLFYSEKSIPHEIVRGTVTRKWVKSQKEMNGYDI